jgi:hypothetical protein
VQHGARHVPRMDEAPLPSPHLGQVTPSTQGNPCSPLHLLLHVPVLVPLQQASQ